MHALRHRYTEIKAFEKWAKGTSKHALALRVLYDQYRMQIAMQTGDTSVLAQKQTIRCVDDGLVSAWDVIAQDWVVIGQNPENAVPVMFQWAFGEA